MKTLSVLFLTIFLLSGCQYYSYDTKAIYQQSLKTYPHASVSDIFLTTDSVIFNDDALHVSTFNVETHPLILQEDLRDTLQKISQASGYDVIVVEVERNLSWEESDKSFLSYMISALADIETDENITTYSSMIHQVKAYKFVKNINYANQFIKSKTLYEIKEDNRKESIYTQSLLPSGLQKSVQGDESALSFINMFSVNHVLDEATKDWTYRWTENDVLIRKHKNYTVKTTFQNSKAGNFPLEISLKLTKRPFTKYRISLFYNNLGEVESKTISEEGKPFASSNYTFDENNRIIKEDLNFGKLNKQYELIYEYFTLDSLKSTLPLVTKTISKTSNQ